MCLIKVNTRIETFTKSIMLLTVVLLVQISQAIGSYTPPAPLSSITNTVVTEQAANTDKIQFGETENYNISTTTTATVPISTTTVQPSLPEVSKTTMDIITIIWYLSTFLALAAFFFLMACSDRRCSNRQQANTNQQQPDQTTNDQCPPTPSPSYSEFAPPTYESIIKRNLSDSHSIYVLPVDLKLPEKKNEIEADVAVVSSTATATAVTATTTSSTATINSISQCTIHTINESPKVT